MDLKKPNLNINLGDLGKKVKKIPEFFDKKRKWVLIFIAILFAIHSYYEYYNYIFNPVWSEEKRQAYIETKEKDAVFNEKDFDEVVAEVEKRKIEYVEGKIDVKKDIFNIQK